MLWLFFFLGVVVGGIISAIIFIPNPIGSLRVYHSDPDSGPYLFVELTRKGANALYTKKYISLKVNIKDYIPHE